MKCPLISEDSANLLLDFSAGRLGAAETADLEQHITGCARCSAFRMDQAELWNVLDEWKPEPVSADFNRGLWRKIDAAERTPWYRGLASMWKPAFGLGVAGLVVTAGFLLDHRGPAPANPPAGNVVSVSDADQMERSLDDIQLLKQFDSATGEANTRKM